MEAETERLRNMKIKFLCRNFAKHAYHQIVMRTRNNNDKNGCMKLV